MWWHNTKKRHLLHIVLNIVYCTLAKICFSTGSITALRGHRWGSNLPENSSKSVFLLFCHVMLYAIKLFIFYLNNNSSFKNLSLCKKKICTIPSPLKKSNVVVQNKLTRTKTSLPFSKLRHTIQICSREPGVVIVLFIYFQFKNIFTERRKWQITKCAIYHVPKSIGKSEKKILFLQIKDSTIYYIFMYVTYTYFITWTRQSKSI